MDDFRAELRSELLAEIAAFLDEWGMSPSRFGRKAANDTDVIKRVRERKFTIETAQRLRNYMAAHRQVAADN
jgi:hypothetical protein